MDGDVVELSLGKLGDFTTRGQQRRRGDDNYFYWDLSASVGKPRDPKKLELNRFQL